MIEMKFKPMIIFYLIDNHSVYELSYQLSEKHIINRNTCIYIYVIICFGTECTLALIIPFSQREILQYPQFPSG